MMSNINPYASPAIPAEAVPRERRFVRTRLSLGILVGSVLAGLAFTCVDEIVLGTKFGAWPVLIGSAVLSVVSAAVTRHALFAPLTCFATTMASDLLAAAVVDVGYAQMDLAVKYSLGFSCPALVVALAGYFWGRRVEGKGKVGRGRGEVG